MDKIAGAIMLASGTIGMLLYRIYDLYPWFGLANLVPFLLSLFQVSWGGYLVVKDHVGKKLDE